MKTKWTVLVCTLCVLMLLSPSTSAARPGIECDCSSTGVWPSPAKGVNLSVKFGDSSPTTGQSPNNKYTITVPFNLNQAAITITRNSDNQEVFHQIYGRGAGWGFSPDDDRFVVHTSTLGAHFVYLYDLTADPLLVKAYQPGIVDMGYITFSRHGKYLQYTSIKDTSVVINVTNVLTGDTNTISGITLESPPADANSIAVAGWGFSPDDQDATFVYAWKHFQGAAVKVRNLATHEDIFEDLQMNLPYGPQTDTAWYFSPCGDLFAIGYESIEDFKAYTTLDGTHVDDGAMFNATSAYFQITADATEHVIHFQSGSPSTDVLTANTAGDPCPVVDTDNDGHADDVDNCPLVHNPDQDPAACADDQDGDGVADGEDNCPQVYNPDQDPTACEANDDTPPTWPDPSTLTASDITETSLQLSWTAAQDNPYQYNLYQDGSPIGQTLAGGPLAFDVVELTPWALYTFKVEAEDAAGNETVNGPIAIAQTLDETPPTWPFDATLTIIDKTATTMTLEWTPAQDNGAVTQYALYNVAGDERVRVMLVDTPDDRIYTFSCLQPSTVYTFAVEAGDGADNWSEDGPWVQEATLSGDPCDLSLERASVTRTGEELTWAAEDDGMARGARISGDGRYVVFVSDADNIRIADWAESPEIHVYDRDTQTTRPLATFQTGQEVAAYADVGQLDISDDGNWVAYASRADFLINTDENNADDIYVTNRISEETERVSVDINRDEVDHPSYYPAISRDGQYVVFQSLATFGIETDTNNLVDIFRYDRDENDIIRVSIATDGQQALLYGVQMPGISGDGRHVVFETADTNLVDGDDNICQGVGQNGQTFNFPCTDIFIRDVVAGETKRVSVDAAGQQVIGVSTGASISSNGRFVAFQSTASTFVANDTNDAVDIFVKDMLTGKVHRASIASDGTQANDGSYAPRISANGRFVTFESRAINLDPADTNDVIDVFVHDCLTGQTKMMSVCACNDCGNALSQRPDISNDGSVVVFESDATNLLVGLSDSNGVVDVFLHEWEPSQGDLDAIPDQGEFGPDADDIAYDGNMDEITDAAQSHVVSITGFDGSAYVTFAAPDGLVFEEFAVMDIPSPDNAPADMGFLWGFFEFTLDGLAFGEAVDVILYLPDDINPTNFFMWSSTADEGSAHWYSFEHDSTTGAEYNANVVTLHLVNGSRGDDDLTTNDNSITVRGGPALSMVQEADISVSPTDVDFGTTTAGSTVGPEVISITSLGNADLTLNSYTITGDDAAQFSVDESAGDTPCSASPVVLASLESCTIGVSFTGLEDQSSTASLEIASTDPDEPVVAVSLSGVSEIVPLPNIDVTPITHDFGTVNEGETSGAAEFTITNNGEGSLLVRQVTLSGQPVFALAAPSANACGDAPFVLVSDQSCAIAATFSPTGFSDYLASLTVHSDDPETPTFPLRLTGTGTMTLQTSAIAYTTSQSDFGYLQVGNTSTPSIVTLHNLGGADLNVSAITTDAAFDAQFEYHSNLGFEACGEPPFTINGGQACELQVVFTPEAAGPAIARLTITSNDAAKPQISIPFRGTGTESQYVPALMMTPASIDFGNIQFGYPSAPQMMTVTNMSDDNIGLTGVAFTPQQAYIYPTFRYSRPAENGCVIGLELAPGETCNWLLTYFASQAFDSATVTMTAALDNVESNIVQISGQGVFGIATEAQHLDISPSRIDYSGAPVGLEVPGSLEVWLTNTGGHQLQVSHIGISDVNNFSIDYNVETNNCDAPPFTLSPYYQCRIGVRFHPQVSGPHEAMIAISSDDPNTPISTISVTGSAFDLAPEPTIRIWPLSYDFGHGNINIDTPAAMKTTRVNVSNIGSPPLTISQLSLSNDNDFSLTACGTLPIALQSVQHCSLLVTFDPQTIGPASTTLTIGSDDPNTPSAVVELTGVGANDQDGLPDSAEHGPNGDDPDYDGDNSGVADSQEAHVASLHTHDGQQYVTLYTNDPGIVLSDIETAGNPSPNNMPADAEFPLGFFEFTFTYPDILQTNLTVTIQLPDTVAAPDTYYKFGPTPDNPLPHWYEFMYDGITGAEINGTEIVLHFRDGQRGDDDLLYNNSITDIGAPAMTTTAQGNPSGSSGGGGGGCFVNTLLD